MNPLLLSIHLQKGIMICPAIFYHQQRLTIAPRMVIDPGASNTIIRPEIVMRLGIDITSNEIIRTITVAGAVEMSKVTLDQIGVCEAHALNVDVLVGTIPEELEIQGIIGYSFLKHFDYCVYYQKQEIVLTPNFKPLLNINT